MTKTPLTETQLTEIRDLARGAVQPGAPRFYSVIADTLADRDYWYTRAHAQPQELCTVHLTFTDIEATAHLRGLIYLAHHLAESSELDSEVRDQLGAKLWETAVQIVQGKVHENIIDDAYVKAQVDPSWWEDFQDNPEPLTLEGLVDCLRSADLHIVDSGPDSRPWEKGLRPPFYPPVFYAKVEARGDDVDLTRYLQQVTTAVWARFERGTMEFNAQCCDGVTSVTVTQMEPQR